jgi:hypothetical protein
MYRAIIFLLLLNVFSVKGYSQCNETDEPRVLLIGDSWAFFMNADQTFNNIFTKWGFSNYKFVSNGTIAENGAQTDDFLTSTKLDEIKTQLNQNPSIEVVHVSIGGNDVLGEWAVSWSQAQTDSLKDEVEGRLLAIIDSIKSFKPGIRIVWSGYTYPNFEEVINDFFIPSQHPFYGTWEGMEFPTFLELNTILNDFSAEIAAYAAADPQVDFINATGILQYTFGQAAPLGVAPGGTYAQYSVPLPEGKPDYPSPKSSMRDYFGVAKDAFHLSAQGYEDLIGYQFQKFYHKYFMDDVYLLSEIGDRSGSTSSQGNVSDSLYLGESGGEQFATVLSFNTTSLDSVVEKASIFLRRKSLSGSNPISGNLGIKVKNGNIGTTVNVDADDFTALGDASGTPCQFGSSSEDGDWVRLDIPDVLLPYINNISQTQFVISAPSASGRMSFYDAYDPDFAPVLNITYGSTPLSVADNKNNKAHFTVYPNPSGSLVNIDTKGETVLRMEVADLMGRVVLKQNAVKNTIDISALPVGTYILNITTDSGNVSQRILKY